MSNISTNFEYYLKKAFEIDGTKVEMWRDYKSDSYIFRFKVLRTITKEEPLDFMKAVHRIYADTIKLIKHREQKIKRKALLSFIVYRKYR